MYYAYFLDMSISSLSPIPWCPMLYIVTMWRHNQHFAIRTGSPRPEPEPGVSGVDWKGSAAGLRPFSKAERTSEEGHLYRKQPVRTTPSRWTFHLTSARLNKVSGDTFLPWPRGFRPRGTVWTRLFRPDLLVAVVAFQVG